MVRQLNPYEGTEFIDKDLKYRIISSLPEEVMIIGCTGTIKDMIVPRTVNYEGHEYNVTQIGDSAFKGNKKIQSADLGSVEIIDSYAFYGCTALKSVSMEKVRSVGIKAFTKCSALSEIGFGGDLVKVCAYSFYGCKSLTDLDLPDKVKTIGSYAFCGCSSMKNVHLGVAVNTIGSKAFNGCPLEIIKMPSCLSKMKSEAFGSISFQDADGNPLATTAKDLAGHTFVGKGGILVLSA